VPNQQSWPLP